MSKPLKLLNKKRENDDVFQIMFESAGKAMEQTYQSSYPTVSKDD